MHHQIPTIEQGRYKRGSYKVTQRQDGVKLQYWTASLAEAQSIANLLQKSSIPVKR